jgi:hypothetical protein
MIRQPTVDSPPWDLVLAHRPEDVRGSVAERFEESGIAPELVEQVLQDGGDALHAAARGAHPDWAEPFGGWLGVALLSAEVSALAAHLNARASAVRSVAVDELLEDFSAITVAAHLGVSRQKIYEISRGRHDDNFIDRVPWR